MKTVSKIAPVLALLMAPLKLAAEPEVPDVGFIRIVHAIVPGEGSARFFLNGDDLRPKGYELGQRTGGIGVRAGAHSIRVTKEGLMPGETKIDLAKDETITLVAFAERIREKAEDVPEWRTKLLRLRQKDADGCRITIVSLCNRPEIPVRMLVRGERRRRSVLAKRLAPAEVDLGNANADVLIGVDEAVVATVSPDGPGNHVVLIYEDADGIVRAVTFFDPKFAIAG